MIFMHACVYNVYSIYTHLAVLEVVLEHVLHGRPDAVGKALQHLDQHQPQRQENFLDVYV